MVYLGMKFVPHSTMLFLVVLWGLSVIVATTRAQVGILNSSTLAMFVDELIDMPRVRGFDVVAGVPRTKTLNIGMFPILWKFHRDIPSTPVFAYGTSKSAATVPGPTIEAVYGVDTYVTWQNFLPQKHILPVDTTIPTAIPPSGNGVPTVVHLHGGIDEPESDGFADSWFTSWFNEKGPTWTTRTYHYRNVQQPGTMWYHDHAKGLTRVNLLAGLIGAYIIRQPGIEQPLGLPASDDFDHVLVVFDRQFNNDGTIYMNSTGNYPPIHPHWQPEYFGDVIIVNGKAWPYMRVHRRKYRFRIINASNARFFQFFFTNGLDFVVVGSDSAYLGEPVKTNNILAAPSEIFDVVIDFSSSTTDTAILANSAAYPYPGGSRVNSVNGNVMKFIIDAAPVPDTSRIPSQLITYPNPDPSTAVQTRYITLFEYTTSTGEVTHLYLNGKPFTDPATETPKPGTSEVWDVINLTGDTHPLHIHVGLFKVLDQTNITGFQQFNDCMVKINDALQCNLTQHATGQTVAVNDHEKGWKNVYKMMPGYVTKILVRFNYIHTDSPYLFDATAEPGYVYHCHMLDHEDNVMMRPLKFIK